MSLLRSAGILLTTCVCASSALAKDVSIENSPPVVVRTIPESGATDVDTGRTEIRVTFSKPMLDQSWSCVNLSEESFPESAGESHYDRDGRTFVMPVRLEPGKTYAVLFNSDKYKNFKDTGKRPAMSYLLVFTTKKL